MKIGILGAGGIAVQMAKTVAGMKDVELSLIHISEPTRPY